VGPRRLHSRRYYHHASQFIKGGPWPPAARFATAPPAVFLMGGLGPPQLRLRRTAPPAPLRARSLRSRGSASLILEDDGVVDGNCYVSGPFQSKRRSCAASRPRPIRSMASFASRSTWSLPVWPECPATHFQSTCRPVSSASSFCSRSRFL